MSDPTNNGGPSEGDDPLAIRVGNEKRSFWRNLSPIWLVPLIAVAIAGAIAWRSYVDRGTLIRIAFENAEGVVARDTTVRFRDVVIGTVEDVRFTTDMSQVIVSARIVPSVADRIPSGAQFWVARPQVSTRGITGLGTVLSGVYIDAEWEPAEEGGSVYDFIGLEAPPLVEAGQEGTRIVIRAQTGSELVEGAPIFYHGLEAGRIEKPELSADGSRVTVQAFVNAPYDKFLTSASRFWDMSGFSVSLGTAGFELNVASLASLISGGIAFDNIFDGGARIAADTTFELFYDEATARNSLFAVVGDNAVTFAIDFEGTVNGLTSGAAVLYKGIQVGKVASISAVVQQDGNRRTVQLRTRVQIDPQSIGLPETAGREDLIEFMSQAVEGGLRARLASQNLFSTALIVELAEVPDAAPATLGLPQGEEKAPVIPSVASDIPDVTATAEGVLRRINDLPIEQLLNQAITLMASIEAIAEDEGTRAAPETFLALLNDARDLIGSDDAKAIPKELNDTLVELRQIAQQLREQGGAERLLAAVDSAGKAADAVAKVSEGLPELVDQVTAVAEKVNALDAEGLIASARSLVDNADALVGSEDIKSLPPKLAAAIDDLRAVVADLNEQGTAEKLAAALDGAAKAADAVTTATEGVPELTAQLKALAEKANGLDAEGLVASVKSLVANADAVIGSEETKALPPKLAAAIDELRAMVADLNQQGAAEKLAAALDSASKAADGVSKAAEGVPELTAQLKSLAEKANALDAETLVASAKKLLDSADALIGTEDARNLPPTLNAAMEQLRITIADINQQKTVERLTAAIDQAGKAAGDVSASAEGVPELVDKLKAFADKAAALDLDALVTSANELMADADALIGSEEARALPKSLSDALDQVRAALQELREGGAVENLNATLDSAKGAAAAIEKAAEDLPALAERLDRVAARAEALLGAYGERSDFNKETLDMLREVGDAAKSVARLARAIERNPNSLLTGR